MMKIKYWESAVHVSSWYVTEINISDGIDGPYRTEAEAKKAMLIWRVIENIVSDIESQDFSAIFELLGKVDEKFLKGFLSED